MSLVAAGTTPPPPTLRRGVRPHAHIACQDISAVSHNSLPPHTHLGNASTPPAAFATKRRRLKKNDSILRILSIIHLTNFTVPESTSIVRYIMRLIVTLSIVREGRRVEDVLLFRNTSPYFWREVTVLFFPLLSLQADRGFATSRRGWYYFSM